jgi:hypothetical protein
LSVAPFLAAFVVITAPMDTTLEVPFFEIDSIVGHSIVETAPQRTILKVQSPFTTPENQFDTEEEREIPTEMEVCSSGDCGVKACGGGEVACCTEKEYEDGKLVSETTYYTTLEEDTPQEE